MSKVLSKESIKTKTLQFEELEKIKKIEDFDKRYVILKKYPFVLPYILNTWKTDTKLKDLIKVAVENEPENILKLSRGGIYVTKELVNLAVKLDPLVIFKLDEEQNEMVSKEAFIEAFTNNPVVLVSDCPVLKEKIRRKVNVYDKDEEKIVEREISSALRTECLKAIRLAEKVSVYHKGYDDFASQIAEKLKASPRFASYKNDEQIYSKIPTVVNVMIKKEIQGLRGFRAENWKLNRNKTLYSAVRNSVKPNSKLVDLLGDIPFDDMDDKIAEKAICNAIKIEPKTFLNLKKYSLDNFQKDAFVQYTAFKYCKKYKDEETWKKTCEMLTKKEIKEAESKIKRESTKKQNKTNKLTETL